jgi:AAA+ superfamily predicted ATPase
MNTYKEQFAEWSPAYPVVFHGMFEEVCKIKTMGAHSLSHSLKTHNITIKAIKKAMEL